MGLDEHFLKIFIQFGNKKAPRRRFFELQLGNGNQEW